MGGKGCSLEIDEAVLQVTPTCRVDKIMGSCTALLNLFHKALLLCMHVQSQESESMVVQKVPSHHKS